MKTVKHPRLGKAQAAARLHVHRCWDCRQVFQVRNADCPRGRSGYACADLCAACVTKWARSLMA